MIYRPISKVLILALSLATAFGIANASADTPLLQKGKKTLFERVLTTPGCTLGAQPGEKGKLQPAFSRFYVYKHQSVGGADWLEVGPDSTGKRAGWLPSACTVEWKMQLALSFTNPAGRDPLLFFKERNTLDKIFASADPNQLVKPIRENMKARGRDPAVVAQEPNYAVDIQKNFYLLPILGAQEVMTEEGYNVRVLNVASVSAKAEAGKAGAESVAASGASGGAQANQGKADAADAANRLKAFSAAVVFVIDSTISMDPYIERTREAVKKIYQRIEDENLLSQVKFGLVAFRSSTKAVPGLEYVSKMYVDPATVKDGKDFLAKVSSLKQANVSSKAFQEDSLAGVMQALNEVDWSQYGGRYIVLITDAGAVTPDSGLSSTGLNPEQVRLEAATRGVAIYSLHLKTPAGVKDYTNAEAQYSDLSNNAYLGKPLYYPIEAGDVGVFGRKMDTLAEALTTQVRMAYSGEMAAGSALGAAPSFAKKTENTPAKSAEDDSLLQDAALLGHAMQLAYLGDVSHTKAPLVFKAWVSDRDLVDQKRATTEVRVLLTKSQLSDLNDVVKRISDAANEGLIAPSKMFEQLQSIAATMGKDANQVRASQSTRLAEMGLLGEYLDDLPYKSAVLSLDEDTWKSWDGLAQEKFIRDLNAKLKYYKHCNADTDRWVSLADGSAPGEYVYPVSIEMLP
ncbi:von Willebrand factor, type A [gamma proteobacterium HdN1]|nr:von Willebrand factor, type A [gamma proteobacterium HdN1]